MARHRLGHHQGDLGGGGIDGGIGDWDEDRLHRHDCPPLPTAATGAGPAGLNPDALKRVNTTRPAKSSRRCPPHAVPREPLDLAEGLEG
jgi:hypothetical protein